MKLDIDLQYCHGIKSFKTTIDFSKGPFLVFAPNGVFKSSFRKTIEDLINQVPTQDLVNPSAPSKRSISIDGKPAVCDDFLVFKSDSTADEFKMSSSSYLSSSNLKSQYDSAMITYTSKRTAFLTLVAQDLGPKLDAGEEIKEAFHDTNLDRALLKIYPSTTRKKNWKSYPQCYKNFFSKNPAKFLSDPSTAKALKKYNTAYKRSVKKSCLFTLGVFEIGDLNAVCSSLAERSYFEGGNTIKLNGQASEIQTIEELQKVVKDAFNKASKDPAVVKSYQNLVKAGSDKDYADQILDLLQANPFLANEAGNPQSFRQHVLLSAIHAHQSNFDDLMAVRKSLKGIVRKMNSEAKKEEKIWYQTFELVKSSFDLDLTINLANTKNIILDLEPPQMSFSWGGTNVDSSILLNDVLSGGERRAFDYARLAFDVLSAERKGQSKILIFDDIADSFDYANKHAIVEFISALSAKSALSIIMLTHNFDFFRLFGSRVASKYGANCYFAIKEPSKDIKLFPGNYFSNIFQNYLVKNATPQNKPSFALSLVTFGRAIIELTDINHETNADYLLYTLVMHYRPNKGYRILCSTIFHHLEHQIPGLDPKLRNDPSFKKSFYTSVNDECNRIASDPTIGPLFEDKLVLALGLRILCENYMYHQLLKKKQINGSQLSKLEFGALFDLFQKNFATKAGKNATLINDIHMCVMFCPPDIHLNAFMFEPIVDYDIRKMRDLFSRLKGETPNYCHPL